MRSTRPTYIELLLPFLIAVLFGALDHLVHHIIVRVNLAGDGWVGAVWVEVVWAGLGWVGGGSKSGQVRWVWVGRGAASVDSLQYNRAAPLTMGNHAPSSS